MPVHTDSDAKIFDVAVCPLVSCSSTPLSVHTSL